MKLPLLLHSSPRLEMGPTVMLAKGDWKIGSNLINSRIGLLLDSNFRIAIPDDGIINLPEDTTVKVLIFDHGTESELTIYAEKL